MKEKCTGKGTLRLCGTANVGTKGQVVIPKEVRKVTDIKPGDSVTFMLKDEKFIGVVPNTNLELLMDYIQSNKDITLIK